MMFIFQNKENKDLINAINFILGYKTRKPELFKLALLHKSIKTEESNERLEFLGDAIFALHPEAAIWIEGVIDPHIWMDVGLFALGIDPIVAALSQKDPQGASFYRARGVYLKRQMEEFDRALQQKMRVCDFCAGGIFPWLCGRQSSWIFHLDGNK